MRRHQLFFFFNDTATTEIYTNLNTRSLHDALPILVKFILQNYSMVKKSKRGPAKVRSEEHTSELQSHSEISYAVFCLKKKQLRYSTIHNSRTSYYTYKQKNKKNQ